MVFAAFDVTGADRAGLAALLATGPRRPNGMTAGPALAGPTGPFAPPADTGEALGLRPSRLTLTVGFGPTLFDDRFGLADRRPAALVELPGFAGDHSTRRGRAATCASRPAPTTPRWPSTPSTT